MTKHFRLEFCPAHCHFFPKAEHLRIQLGLLKLHCLQKHELFKLQILLSELFSTEGKDSRFRLCVPALRCGGMLSTLAGFLSSSSSQSCYPCCAPPYGSERRLTANRIGLQRVEDLMPLHPVEELVFAASGSLG